MNGFREITHTADIGLEIHANTIEKLFIFSLDGYYKLALSDNYSCRSESEFNYTTDAIDYEDLLVTYLSEINYLLMVKNQVIKPIRSIKIMNKDNKLFLFIRGKTNSLFNPEIDIETEIKAVTYHQVKIIEEDGLFKTKIFFDT